MRKELLLVLLGLTTLSIAVAQIPQPPALAKVTAVPAALVQKLKLAPFYKKHLDVDGFPILSSEKVSDEGLLEAAHLIRSMLQHRPDVVQALAKNKVRFAVMSPTELTTDIPEHSDLKPKAYWDKRARGLGATPARPAVSCGEENLLNLPGDPYAKENILVHEFGHAIHEMALTTLDKTFDGRLQKVYAKAMDQGLWKKTYAATNYKEYWAEGVQSYYDTNRANDTQHNDIDTREKLAKYDPVLFELIDEVFKKNQWRYVRFDKRFPEKAKEIHKKYLQDKKKGMGNADGMIQFNRLASGSKLVRISAQECFGLYRRFDGHYISSPENEKNVFF